MRITSALKATLITLVASLIVFVPNGQSPHADTGGHIALRPINMLPMLPESDLQPKVMLSSKVINPANNEVTSLPSGSHEDWMAQAGIAQSDYMYVDFIVSHESGWCPTKWQGEYNCPGYYRPLKALTDGWVGYGICQSTPGIKMSTMGGDYLTNPVLQLRWCVTHANASHGGWANSYNYWLAHRNW